MRFRGATATLPWLMSTDAPDARLPIFRHPDLRRYLTARFIVSVDSVKSGRSVASDWSHPGGPPSKLVP